MFSGVLIWLGSQLGGGGDIKIYYDCEDGKEKSAQWIAVWHHEAGDPEGRSFLSHPYTINGFLFLLTIQYHILCLKRFSEVPEYFEKQYHMMTSL